jgi:hypothetical protein
VVLTSLLAIVGTIFLMAARVDKIATSAISENKELKFAVEAVLAEISHELALDVPRARGAEYYDYPGSEDEWLASLEPSEGSPYYEWRQISDVYYKFDDQKLDAKIIPDYQDSSDVYEDGAADADGDGVADSKWVRLDGKTSGKGKRIYAAIRVIDNSAMINLNTAYEFDSAASRDRIDGSSLTQVNLKALARTTDTIDHIDNERNPGRNALSDYERDCIWRMDEPEIDYEPFYISDELELRNRFLCTSLVEARVERQDVWNRTLDAGGGPYAVPEVPVGQGAVDLDGWESRVDANSAGDKYERRHILTTYNMDRIIDPNGDKMLSINDINEATVDDAYQRIKDALDNANYADANEVAAQVAVNLIDFRDEDSNITDFNSPDDGRTYSGFESPCIYISEIAHRFRPNPTGGGPIVCDTFRSYAVELYKPYPEDAEPNNLNQWRLFIDNSSPNLPGDATVDIDDWRDGADFHVIRWHNPMVELDVDSDASSQDKPNICNQMFDAYSVISLQRRRTRGDSGSRWVTVDSVQVPPDEIRLRRGGIGDGWLIAEDGTALSVQRDITLHKCIRRLWSGAADAPYTPTLGYRDDDDDNDYRDSSPEKIQAHPADKMFTNVGEIGMLFSRDVYDDSVIKGATEGQVRLDLTNSAFQKIFQYLTRFDPSSDNINNDGDYKGSAENIDEIAIDETPEFKIPGRININTAPWYVMAQLPWIQYGDSTPFEKARRICDYRDNNTIDGFKSTGELMQVTEMHYCASAGDSGDLAGFPDLTTPDHPLGGAEDDFEERDVIFARISDLVTVRSDVFTAYILVRIGIDGPQKRVIAVLDRSNVYNSGGKVRVTAMHPVPDPR